MNSYYLKFYYKIIKFKKFENNIFFLILTSKSILNNENI